MAFEKGNIPWNKGKTSWNNGIPMSTDAKRKLSEAKMGSVPWNKGVTGYNTKPCSNERKEFLSRLNKGNKYCLGRVVSDKTKQKMSKSAKWVLKTKEHRLNLSKAKMGQPSPVKGIPKSEDARRNMVLNHADVSGERNPNWRGGISFKPYCDKFNNKLKEIVRDRDNRTCQLCDKSETNNGRKLDVHHIHYDKPNCEPDLISLCRRCNLKVNYNRDYYEELFMTKLTRKAY